MKNYFQLLRYLLPYKSLVIFFFIFSVLTIFFSLISLLMLVPCLELLFDKTKLVTEAPSFSLDKDYFLKTFYFQISEKIRIYGKPSALSFFCIIVCVIFLLKNLFRYLALYVLAPLRNRLILDLRSDLYQKLIKLPITYFKNSQKGDIITHFTTDLAEIEYSIMNTIEVAIQSPLNIFFFLMAMLMISPPLTGFVFGMIVIMALIVGNIGKSLKKESKNAKGMLGKLTSLLDESYTGTKILRAFGASNWMKDRFDKENYNLYLQFNRMYRKRDLSSPLTEFLAIIVVCIVLWYGGNLVLTGHFLTASKFITFMVIFSQLIPPAKSFSAVFYEIKKGMASYERISEIIQSKESLEKETTTLTAPEFKYFLKLENVSFSYPNSEQIVIQDFSFTFEYGKKYAIVGPSGAGKSTLFDLLLRFYNPSKGEITLDYTNINYLHLEEYRKLFGIVSQDPILFDHYILENICLGAPQNIEKVKIALSTANALEFVEKNIGLKGSYLGERGEKLSGGERQRISIARVAYRNPEIVLLDEATSALDSKNELEVQLGLNNLLKDKTSIIIAHRLTTIMNADQILVMQEGQLKEVGSHLELINKGGLYSKMVEMQQI